MKERKEIVFTLDEEVLEVPAPARSSRRRSAFIEALDGLAVGRSLVAEDVGSYNLSTRTKPLRPKKFISRKLDANETGGTPMLRIWRTE